MVGDGMAIALLGRVVRDAWHQCKRRPLAVLLGVLFASGSPGFPPHMIQGSQELHGWANLAWLGLPAVIVLGYLAPLLMVAYLGTANPSQPRPAGGAIRAAVRMTRRAWRPGIGAAILTWVFVAIPGTISIWLGEALLGPSFMADPPDLSSVAQRQELLFRLTVVWPLTAIGLAVLALLLSRVVLDGARDVGRAANLSGRIARRAPLVCLLIGLLDAAGAVIRVGTSFATAVAVAAVVGLGAVFATAMANALLWHTRPWQPIDDEAEQTRGSRW
jgi:hypothetical protein